MPSGLELYENMRTRLADLQENPPAAGNPNAAKHYQELGRLEKSLRPYLEYLEVSSERDDAKQMLEDPELDAEMQELAKDELRELSLKADALLRGLLIQLVEAEAGDHGSAILEIRAGTGGEEAALFVGDLYRMYRHYSDVKGWKIEVLDSSDSDMGGFREIIFRVEGEGAYGRLRFEAGTHRVQRVPKTETQGRIHTSASTVAVLAEAEDVEIEIKDTDLEISYMRSQGPGGQSVNTTDSCVRILHKPTGVQVKCMVEKSQKRNQELAMRILRARLFEAEQERAAKERSDNRRNQIGSGDRSERIRTYNYPQNRVTDHRLEGEKNFSLEKVVTGDIDPIMLRLFEQAAGLDAIESAPE